MDRPDPRVTVADDRVDLFEEDGARFLFACGPPAPVEGPEARMTRVLEALAPDLNGIRWGEQIHGRLVASLAPEGVGALTGVACVGRCDALITDRPALGLIVWTADCVPILLAGDGVVAAAHSGWRGTVADIVGAVVGRFRSEYGVDPHRLHALLGPAISGPHYEVSDEVVADLGGLGVDQARWRSGRNVDLRGFLTARLEQLGLHPERVRTVGPCTASTPELASYRRDGAEAGRQWSMVYQISPSY